MKKSKLLLVAVIALTFWWLSGYQELLTLEQAQQQQAALNDYIATNWLMSGSIYFVIYVIVTAVSIPGALILTLLGGALFGFTWGLIFVSFASTLGATLSFLFSRYLLRDWVQKKFSNHLQTINKGMQKDGDIYLLTLRLIPLFPFFVINLLMGLTKMPIKNYYLFSQLGMLPGTILYVNAGTQLADIQNLQDILSPTVLGSFVLLGLFPLIINLIVSKVQQVNVYKKWKKPKIFDRNMIVIGAGAGGLVSAYIAAAVKSKVTLIEKHKMGGDCLNTGCVPSKALIKSCNVIKEATHAGDFGIDVTINEIDFKKVMARVKQVITQVEPHDSIERYTELGVECLQGDAKIINPWTVEINQQQLTTQNIVICTGAKPFVPDIPGLNEVNFVTSDTVWDIDVLPKKLLVLGAGPIGCELAQSFQRLGSQVAIVEAASQILFREDPDTAKVIEKQFIKEGIKILVGHKVIGFTAKAKYSQAELLFEDKSVFEQFDTVLIATGRKANVTGFGLQTLGIELSDRGTIVVNEYLQTKYKNIFAVGDVTGPFQLTHAAAHQAWYATVNGLFGAFKKFKVDYSVLPSVTYSNPEVARVGINEQQAKLENIAIDVYQYQLDDLDRAIADGQDTGFVKVLTAKGSDKILGATIVSNHASDMLAEFTLAMRYKIGLNKILSTIHPYPTMSEANKYVAGLWRKDNAPQKLLTWVEKYHHWTRTKGHL